MQKKLPIKLTLFAICLPLILGWLWSSADQGVNLAADSTSHDAAEYVSRIQPSEDAVAQPAKPTQLQQPFTKSNDFCAGFDEISAAFDRAQSAIKKGDSDTAINRLSVLIQDHPEHLEPYINLASLYARAGQIELARKTLMQGINVHKNTAILFSNLQKVHGVLAANAYQTALAEEGEEIATVELSLMPLIESIELPPATCELASPESYAQPTATVISEVATLRSQLDKAQQGIAIMQNDHQLEIAILKQRLQQQIDLKNTFAKNEKKQLIEQQRQDATQEATERAAAVSAKPTKKQASAEQQNITAKQLTAQK